MICACGATDGTAGGAVPTPIDDWIILVIVVLALGLMVALNRLPK